MQRDKVLAIDFDGTIYDKKTKSMVDGAENAIRELHRRGYVLVLWTCRTGNALANAKKHHEKIRRYGFLLLYQRNPRFCEIQNVL